jgi:glycosyltransferase involved in cell wall biosynthesis
VKIAVNTQLLLKDRLEGIGSFAHEVLKRMVKASPQHEFIFIFDRPWSDEFIYGPNVIPVKTWIPSRHPILWYWHYQIDIPILIKHFKPDIFFSPDGWMPLNLSIPVVDTIHDLNFVHRPGDFPMLYRKYFNHFFPKFAVKSSKIITVSNYSKSDMVEQWGIPEDKIDVAYNGCNTHYSPITIDLKKEIQNKFTQGLPYFIYIGSQNPRKNIQGLLKAFDQFKMNTGSPYKLVLVGEPMWNRYGSKYSIEDLLHSDDLVFTGRVSDEVLHLLLASAQALMLVSFSEGFGIPVVEAMYCDVPVICSSVASLPEVAGEAALLVDPFNIHEIANSMAEAAYNHELRRTLIAKGRQQKEKFSWDKTAEVVWNAILKTRQ